MVNENNTNHEKDVTKATFYHLVFAVFVIELTFSYCLAPAPTINVIPIIVLFGTVINTFIAVPACAVF